MDIPVDDYQRMLNEFDDLLEVNNGFGDLLDEQRAYLGAEAFEFDRVGDDDVYDAFEEYSYSFEEERESHASVGIGKAMDHAVVGLVNKGANGVKNVAEKTPKALLDLARHTGVGIGKLARMFMENLTNFVNKISTMTSKLLTTLYPLMGKIIDQATKLRDKSANADTVDKTTIEVKGANNYMALGNGLASPDDLMKQLALMGEIVNPLLGLDKLKAFEEISNAVLEPYAESIGKSSVDPLVFTMAVVGTLTNPGVLVGSFLRKIASATNPGAGEVLDKGAKLIGGTMTAGLAGLVTASVTTAGPMIKEMQQGRLDISTVPKFHTLYPFCENKKDEEGGLFVLYQSEVLLGNYQWNQRDYVSDLKDNAKGSVNRVGATFDKLKVKVDSKELKPLRSDQVVKVCNVIIGMMKSTQDHCKAWPQYSERYLTQYKKISSIVMSYNPDSDEEDGGKSMVGRYVRYSYRNSMNIVLGSVWKNCFGADNQFIRYLVNLSRFLLKYADASVTVSKEKDEVKEAKEQKGDSDE